jgi:predicted ATP-grasp superfamily ATP-dependent carboligase
MINLETLVLIVAACQFFDQPLAVLLGGLTLLRPLGQAGIPAVVASGDRDNPALLSRYCCAVLHLPPVWDEPQVLETLLEAGERLGARYGSKPVLFYGNDDQLRLLIRHEAALARHYRFLLNRSELASTLLDPPAFARRARALGLPVPLTYAWGENSAGDLPPLTTAPGAVLVKPTNKFDWERSPVFRELFGGCGKARIYPSASALLADPVARRLRDRLLVQDYIPGDDRQIYSFHGFADESSRLLAAFVGRKIRTYPPQTGESAYLELVAGETTLEALGQAVVAQLGLRGVFKMDFKRDARDGRFYLLEINPRFNLWHQLGAANGINLPALAYAYLTRGANTAPAAAVPVLSAPAPRVRWLNFALDRPAFREARRQGALTLRGYLASLAGVPKVYRLWSWRDPLPFFARLLPHTLRRWFVCRATV